MAFDTDLKMLDSLNITDEDMEKQRFADLVSLWVEQAIEDSKAVIANNLITDSSKAPKTNIHLKDLRMVVAIPIEGYGAIYLDQAIRKGVFERVVVDKITQLANHLAQSGETGLSEDDMIEMYNEM
ncbi:MAG: hypothetical protein Q9P01_13935 [Anaerolineae bacterium]|nr:hypothetical protein [Anaerolineae bacterium]